MLPELKADFPEVRVVDQLFNDKVHVHKNRKYDAWIDATIAPSPAVCDSLVARFAAERSRIHIIPHGVEIPDRPQETHGASKNGFRRKLTVGFFGRFSPEKGPDLFVQIAHRLSKRDDLSFVMTGDGPERPLVASLIQKYKLDDRLSAPGFVEDLEPHLCGADIVVLPSRLDGMPLIVLEAQAREKTVVASRVGSLPHMVEHGETGFLCEPENIDDFCACILKAADDPELRKRMGKAARAAAERHGEARMFELYDSVFDGAAQALQESAPQYARAVRG
jgi:glycosyltransferase involved in cell wall biosynthesis